eukprot:GHVQ01012963.1.p1 GENE.GHVQ01012963.1~~GHVQ01012963.1.p1  ORF type:complete len:514 (+),score=66.30 GHVQ01012963.1:34-1575(+)
MVDGRVSCLPGIPGRMCVVIRRVPVSNFVYADDIDEFGRSKSYSLEQTRPARSEQRIQRRRRQHEAARKKRGKTSKRQGKWEADLEADYTLCCDGYDTSDDSDAEGFDKFHEDKDAVITEALKIFDDVEPEFLDIQKYLNLFSTCKLRYPDEFDRLGCKDAVADVLSMLVRWQLIWWNPLYFGYPSPSSSFHDSFPLPKHSGDTSFLEPVTRLCRHKQSADMAEQDSSEEDDVIEITRAGIGKTAEKSGQQGDQKDSSSTAENTEPAEDALLRRVVIMSPNLEEFDWLRIVVDFVENVESKLLDKSDESEEMDVVVPLVRKAVYPRFGHWILCWNPTSRIQSKGLAAGLEEMLLFKQTSDMADVEDMLRQVQARMQQAVASLLPTDALAGSALWRASERSTELETFSHRLLWRGLKLGRCWLYFSAVYNQSTMQELILQKILLERIIPLVTKSSQVHREVLTQFLSLIPLSWLTYGVPKLLTNALMRLPSSWVSSPRIPKVLSRERESGGTAD